jgi:hypothetical protein
MIMVRNILLGATASVAVVAGAQAADLPVKAKPVEYVKVCSLYGAGFYYVPGTDTCIKFGGYVRVQLDVGGGSGGQTRGLSSQSSEGRNDRNDTANTNFRNRIRFDIDARTQTAYGTLRSYARFGMQQTTPGNAVGGTNFWDRAFIQFAGFTIGHAVSFFDIYTFSGSQSLMSVRTAGETGSSGITIFAYTYQFGNGFSASVSLEDPGVRQEAIFNLNGSSFSLGSSPGDSPAWANGGQGQRFWDVVGQLRLDQSWGYIAVSGALADASGGNYTCTNSGGGVATSTSEWTFCGSPGNALGWAASVGGKIKMPFAPGDSLGVNFVYAKGATGYATNVGRAEMYGSDPGFANSGIGSMGVAWSTSAVFDNRSSNVELTTAWSINAGYEHVWNPAFRQVAHFGYAKVEYNDNAAYLICTSGALPLSSITNCNPDFSFWQAGLYSKWTPVRGLDVGLDVVYTKLNTAFEGYAYLPSNGSRPAGDYRIEDQDQWTVMFRVQRNFP